MSVRPIRLFGDPVLRTPATRVDAVDSRVRSLVQDLLDTVAEPGRAGVAANQIGASARVFSYNIDARIGYVINPVLVETSGEPVPMGEGCLSIPGLWHDTPRHPFARVIGTDLDGAEVVLEGEGLLAQALQHETDHLDGRVFVQRLAPDDRRAAMRLIRESEWFNRRA